jgi:hypothetical protein
MLAGLQQIAPVAAMFVFAILYFGIMTDAGMLDPIVDRILLAVGMRPTRIVLGSALLALLVHLDGSGAVTFLVTVPAMLPLYERLGMDKRILACVASMAAGVNFLPWTGPTLRASAALHVSTTGLFRPLIPVQVVGLVFVFLVAYLLGAREERRLGLSAVETVPFPTPSADRRGAPTSEAWPILDQQRADAAVDGRADRGSRRSRRPLHARNSRSPDRELRLVGPSTLSHRRAREGGRDDGRDSAGGRCLYRDHDRLRHAEGDGAVRGTRSTRLDGEPHAIRSRPGLDAPQSVVRS